MLTLQLLSSSPDPAVMQRAADLIRGGGIVAYPTDTLYGLAADPRSDEAMARLFAVKGRGHGAAVPLVAADLEQAQAAGQFGVLELRLAEAFWPGPLSLVVPARRSISSLALGGRSTAAIRVPAHPVARALAAAAGFAVTATSANLSGAPAVAAPADLDPNLAARIDLLLDAGTAPGGEPSTLIGFDESGPILLRRGAIAWERVLKSLE
jgi:L-threonylcarbamoyladenylate synthase